MAPVQFDYGTARASKLIIQKEQNELSKLRPFQVVSTTGMILIVHIFPQNPKSKLGIVTLLKT